MKRAFGSRRSNIALPSYSPKANASLSKLKKYDILYLKDGDIMANGGEIYSLLDKFCNVCYNCIRR